ncbi:MAG TPA: alpha/beta hydrolase [Patescibacteria group bacterium]
MQTIIDGILTNYEVFGSPKNQNILIVHGWGRSLNDWIPTAKELAKDNYVVAVDLPGFGASSHPETSFDTYAYSDFLKSFIQKLNLKNPILVGHSFGGKTLAVVTSQMPNIKKLILIDASGVDKKSSLTSLKIALSKIIKPLMFFMPKNLKNKIFDKLASSDYRNAGNLKESFKKIVSQDISKDLEKIQTPAVIIWGDKDKEVPLSSAKRFNTLIKNSRIKIVWNAGHHPQFDKPEKFLEILKDSI